MRKILSIGAKKEKEHNDAKLQAFVDGMEKLKEETGCELAIDPTSPLNAIRIVIQIVKKD